MAEALLRLRATYLSGDFDEYFAFYVRADQRRLDRWQEWRVAARVAATGFFRPSSQSSHTQYN
jgi:hypothetical protein